MPTLPQLIAEDIQRLDEALDEMLAQADATAALVTDKGGFVLTHRGEAGEMDFTTIGALASGAFMANQTIAGLVGENNFNSIYQEGDHRSVLAMNVDEHCLLVIIFPAQSGVGAVRYFSSVAVRRIARQLATAAERAPGRGLDLSELNVANPEALFRKKTV